MPIMCDLEDNCCICLKRKTHLRRLLNSYENVNYYSRLVLLIPEVISTVLYNQGAICVECCSNVDGFYKFREECLQNIQTYVNYTSQLSSVFEPGGELCSDLIYWKEEQRELFPDCDQSEKQCSSIEILRECDKTYSGTNATLEKNVNNSVVESRREEIEININNEKVGNMHPGDSRYSDMNIKVIDIKTEQEADCEYEVKTGIKRTAECENGPRVAEDVYLDNKTTNINYIEEVNLKCEPTDTFKYEGNEMESPAITNTEGHSTRNTYCISSSTDDMSQYKYNTNIIITEAIEIKAECADDVEYEESAGQDTATGTSSSETDEDCESLTIDKCIQPTKIRTSHLIRHKKMHSGEKSLKCHQCEKVFSQLSNLSKHKLVHSGEKPFKCDQCDKAFSQLANLTTHKRMHSGEKPFKCDQCNKTFTRLASVITHKRVHSGEKPFKCDECDRSFSQTSSLWSHKRLHSGEKQFICDQCDKAFTKSSYLITHKRVHSGEKPFKCDQCGKAFPKLSTLNTHKQLHSGEKPFKCDQCDKAFSQISSLIPHKRIHSGEKPFKCDQCDKAFSQSANLTKHKRIHSGEKPFKCEQCNKVFSDPSSFTKHKRRHSGERLF